MITRRNVLRAAAGGALLPLGGVLPSLHAQTNPASVAPAAAPGATLGVIRGITLAVGGLREAEAAWTQYMGYKLIKRGKISRATAKSWQAPALAGKAYVVLGPASGEPTYLRFVDQPIPQGWDRAGTFGWNNVEITVQNSDELYERLQGSPFKLLSKPNEVPTFPYLKSFGASGPSGERLLMTWIKEKRPDLAEAKSFVGRCYFVTQASPDLQGSLDWYKATFSNPHSPIRQLPNVKLAVVTLKDGAKIQLDQHPPGGRPRDRLPGGLPPGLAIVSFECSSFDAHAGKFLSPPVKSDLDAFRGREVATVVGPAGELMELIKT